VNNLLNVVKYILIQYFAKKNCLKHNLVQGNEKKGEKEKEKERKKR